MAVVLSTLSERASLGESLAAATVLSRWRFAFPWGPSRAATGGVPTSGAIRPRTKRMIRCCLADLPDEGAEILGSLTAVLLVLRRRQAWVSPVHCQLLLALPLRPPKRGETVSERSWL